MSGIEGSAIPIIESDHKDKLTEKKKEQLKIQPKKFLESVGWSILFVLIYTLIGTTLITVKNITDKDDDRTRFWQITPDSLLGSDTMLNTLGSIGLYGETNTGYFGKMAQDIKVASNKFDRGILDWIGFKDNQSNSTKPTNPTNLIDHIVKSVKNLFSGDNIGFLIYLFSPIIFVVLIISTIISAVIIPMIELAKDGYESFIYDTGSEYVNAAIKGFIGFLSGGIGGIIAGAIFAIPFSFDMIGKILFYTFGSILSNEHIGVFKSSKDLHKIIGDLANTILAIFLLLILISAYYYINVTFASGGFTIYLIWLISINFSGQFEELGKKFSGMFSSQKK